jgi:four helix bundle protein
MRSAGLLIGENERETVGYENLKKRTRQFALDVIRLVESLPANRICNILGHQLLRAGTSVGANYRAACRAKSAADFISKMGTVEEEADESGYWMELLVESGKLKLTQASPLIKEAGELTAIAVASINTTRKSGNRR